MSFSCICFLNIDLTMQQKKIVTHFSIKILLHHTFSKFKYVSIVFSVEYNDIVPLYGVFVVCFVKNEKNAKPHNKICNITIFYKIIISIGILFNIIQ